jgi:hypothetical protein
MSVCITDGGSFLWLINTVTNNSFEEIMCAYSTFVSFNYKKQGVGVGYFIFVLQKSGGRNWVFYICSTKGRG